jgi:hypothetical protein
MLRKFTACMAARLVEITGMLETPDDDGQERAAS